MAKAPKRTGFAPGNEPSGQTAENSDVDAGMTEDHRDRVSMRAYELYLARGGADGRDFDDWLAAEREIGAGNASRGDSGE